MRYRPVLKYPGSKWRLADHIVRLMPQHHTYLEPYFGSGAVLFNKPLSRIETVNDLDNRVCTLFRLIRERPEDLARAVALMPYSRREYDLTFEVPASDELEAIRQWLIQCWQGHGYRTNECPAGWKMDVQGREGAYALRNWVRLPVWIMDAAERLRLVQITNEPALHLIERHKSAKVLIYADPPYLFDTRAAKQYRHEMSDADHAELLTALLQHPGPVMLSGYDSELYNDKLAGWHKISFAATAEMGLPRMEQLWLNFMPALQGELF